MLNWESRKLLYLTWYELKKAKMERTFDKARQVLQMTSEDRETRASGGFANVERDLPAVGSFWSIPLLDQASSYLGGANPIAQHVDPTTEKVWLLDTTAYRPVHPYPHTPQPFQAEVYACYFKRTGEEGKDVSRAVADISQKIGLGDNDGVDKEQAEKTIAHRLQPFVDTIAPARSVDVLVSEGRTETLGPGGRSAVSQQTIVALNDHRDGERVQISPVPAELAPHGPMTVNFAETEGWMVISDIDDTVKTTMTPSPIGILRSTFVDPPSPIPGMPALYTQINSLLNPSWFYLSASPYNLYPFLRHFLHTHYPPGPILLRDASWMDLGGFLASLTQGTEAYKSGRMETLHGWLPQRKVLCVGDSTQSDPEAYGDMYRKYPGWVRTVFIRKVTDVAEMKGTDKNTDARFEKAFRDVPREVWRTFEDPAELTEAVEGLKGT